MSYTTIDYEEHKQTAIIGFHRPDLHNAFNPVMLTELSECFEKLQTRNEVRTVIIRGDGPSFCAGADLAYMRSMKDFDLSTNFADSLLLADCFHLLYTLPQPTICRVHGAAIGGGVGFVAACDFVFATLNCRFSLSEVKIGLVPACISPYIIKRLGEVRTRQLFITGERFDAVFAQRIGLVDEALDESEIDRKIDSLIELIGTSGPSSVRIAKKLVHDLSANERFEKIKIMTAEVIASIRISPEAQEGMSAFLSKRQPNWVVSP